MTQTRDRELFHSKIDEREVLYIHDMDPDDPESGGEATLLLQIHLYYIKHIKSTIDNVTIEQRKKLSIIGKDIHVRKKKKKA